jgi:tetratricopeptide (TPR) repeat protein
MRIAHLDELDAIELSEGFVWRPVRRHFGIQAFGVNAYTPGASGRVVEEHTEETLEHEEIYLVLRGRIHFTLGDDERELAAGQLVFVRDPSLRRGAVAQSDDAAVLAIGGKPGEPHEVSAWEYVFVAAPHLQAGRYDEAKRALLAGLEAKPGNSSLLYNLACAEALLGEREAALEHLNIAVAMAPRFLEWSKTDSDFDSIRDDPRFPR